MLERVAFENSEHKRVYIIGIVAAEKLKRITNFYKSGAFCDVFNLSLGIIFCIHQ